MRQPDLRFSCSMNSMPLLDFVTTILSMENLNALVNSLLQLVDRFTGNGFIIAATNHERQLDPAIWRRFDEIVYFSKPGKPEKSRGFCG